MADGRGNLGCIGDDRGFQGGGVRGGGEQQLFTGEWASRLSNPRSAMWGGDFASQTEGSGRFIDDQQASRFGHRLQNGVGIERRDGPGIDQSTEIPSRCNSSQSPEVRWTILASATTVSEVPFPDEPRLAEFDFVRLFGDVRFVGEQFAMFEEHDGIVGTEGINQESFGVVGVGRDHDWPIRGPGRTWRDNCRSGV